MVVRLSAFIRRWQPPQHVDRRTFANELAELLAETRRDERESIAETRNNALSAKLQHIAKTEPKVAEAIVRLLA